jgi:hypothetical protein
VIMPLNLLQMEHLNHYLRLRNQVKMLSHLEFFFILVLQLLLPLKLFAEDRPSESQSSQLGHSKTFSKLWMISNKGDLTPEQEGKIDDFVEKMQPQFPVLVVQMKKSSAKRQNPVVVSVLVLSAYWIILCHLNCVFLHCCL